MELINGLREPDAEELSKLEEYKNPTAEKSETKIDVNQLKDAKGLPEFWLKAMEHDRILGSHVKEHDKPILKYMTNVTIEDLKDNDYKVIFTFAPNEYFKNSELTKIMMMDKEDKEICKETKGTEIQWNEGKNVTVSIIKKKQKNKKTKAVREVTKTVEQDSFFNFFKSRKAPEGPEEKPEESDEEHEKEIEAIENDIDIAEEVSNELIPRALYYYMDLVEEEGSLCGEDEDEQCESSEEEKPKHGKKKGKGE